MKISVIVPTYNERENLEELFERIDRSLKGYDYEIIVVDDDSPPMEPGSSPLNSRRDTPPLRSYGERMRKGYLQP